MDIEKIFNENKLLKGRMISGSKSSYYQQHPHNFVVFNANVINKEEGKVWFGDLDLTLDGRKLKKVAREYGKVLYVLREMDCRFSHEKDSIDVLISKAVWSSDKGRLR